MSNALRVAVWNEFHHEKHNPVVAAIYPEGIHAALKAGLVAHGLAQVRTATLEEPEHGLTEAALDATDVLVWWGHKRHDDVDDAIVERVKARVLAGMGLVVLHSGHYSKLFRSLMGTPCTVNWRAEGEKERMWVVQPEHPIMQGVERYLEVPREEMYGEPFGIPTPDELLMISWFQGGEVFRSACTWTRGRGRVFYFRPGHETFPAYHQEGVLRIVANGVRWAAPTMAERQAPANVKREALEPIG
jgi:trehalose utilization protein